MVGEHVANRNCPCPVCHVSVIAYYPDPVVRDLARRTLRLVEAIEAHALARPLPETRVIPAIRAAEGDEPRAVVPRMIGPDVPPRVIEEIDEEIHIIPRHIADLERREIDRRMIEHIQEASLEKTDPIEFAFLKRDLQIAEQLFEKRESDLVAGRPTYKFPGYEFRNNTGKNYPGLSPVWQRLSPVIHFIKDDVPRRIPFTKVDIEAIALLRRYDKENLWCKVFPDMLGWAVKYCDLEAILYLYPLRNHPGVNQGKANQALSPVGFCYIVDPFLIDFPFNPENRSHCRQGNRCNPSYVEGVLNMFRNRPDDTPAIRHIKMQLREVMHDRLGDCILD